MMGTTDCQMHEARGCRASQRVWFMMGREEEEEKQRERGEMLSIRSTCLLFSPAEVQ